MRTRCATGALLVALLLGRTTSSFFMTDVFLALLARGAALFEMFSSASSSLARLFDLDFAAGEAFSAERFAP